VDTPHALEMKLKDGLVIGPGDYKDEFQIKGM